ncbi:MAG: LPS biosynthesis protein WbpP [Phycisphaeraceae bacterium]|nr:LPS biosynthesis protein WbpP [Phycisphaeraceae bacterium]
MTDWKQLYGDELRRCPVLVTGGAGFIGSHLCDALVALGAEVTMLDDLSGGDPDNLAHHTSSGSSGLRFVEGSILDEDVLAASVKGRRFVFHQAALPSVPRSIEHPRLFHDVNVNGTVDVLEAARAAGVERVTFAASSSAYGDSEELPKVETITPTPCSPYAANKVCGEQMMRAWASSYGLDTISLRYFNIFGPRQNANSAYAGVIAAFAKAVLNGVAPVIYGDGLQSRDFTFVENVVHANLLAVRSGDRLGGNVINVGCGDRITVNRLAETMAEVAGGASPPPEHRPVRQGDVLHSLADLGQAEALIGYRPIVGFREGLEATVDWYRAEEPW